MNKTRMIAIYLKTPPAPESLPEIATVLLKLSPQVGIRPPDMLYLDIGRTMHLFGGEEETVNRLRAFLSEKQIHAHVALADDVATAGAVARMKNGTVPRGKSEEALAPLPIDLLTFLSDPLSPPSPLEIQQTAKAIQLLRLLGISTLGGFARLPASTIGQRFGKLGVELHRRARGDDFTPLAPFEPVITYRESQHFEDPIGFLDPLLFVTRGLLGKLEQRLKKDLNAALSITLFLETEDAQEKEIVIPLTRPLQRAEGWFGIIREKLSRTLLEAPLLSLTIEISLPIRVRGGQFHLFDSSEQQNEQLDELLGRLIAGLGPTVVSAAELRARYRPETSWQETSFDPIRNPSAEPINMFPRPAILVSPPQPMDAYKEFRSLQLMSGPERLRGEWWQKGGYARDYFVAKAKTGEQLWIFKDLQNEKMFLHGYFD